MTEPISKGERTRQAILDAAYELFIEQGFHATSMRQIAARAGLALGGIYNHFESKEQIFDDLLLDRHPYQQILAILRAAPGETAEEFVHNTAAAILGQMNARPDFIKLVFIELSEFKGKHVSHLYQTIFPKFSSLAERFFGASGPVRSDLPMQTILFTFFGTLVACYLTTLQTGPAPQANLENALKAHLDIFLHGILKTERP